MAQKRLARLYDDKRIKRDRFSLESPFFYYLERPGQIEHRIGVNWVYVWQRLNLTGWQRFHSFEWEVEFKRILRADGLMAVKNVAYNALEFSFVEFDVVGSKHPFDKVQRYNNLYESREWLRTWWGPLASGFPRILVVTTGTTERIADLVKRENRNDLDFRVYTHEQIKGECLHGRGSNKSLRTV